MQESTKSRLTVFARLWAVSMVLFVALCIVAVVACMNERTQWLGLAVVGTVVVLIVQLCQLIAAFSLRRWWCVAGGVVGMLVSIFVMLCSIVALAAGQYRPPVIYEAADSLEVAAADSVMPPAEEDEPRQFLPDSTSQRD